MGDDWVPWAQEQLLGLGLIPRREMASVRATAFRSRKHPKEGGLIIRRRERKGIRAKSPHDRPEV